MLELREFRVLDRNSESCGVPVTKLMDNAGARVAETVLQSGEGRKHVLLVCGPGNNGGDGLTAARLLRGKKSVHVLTSSPDYRSPMLRERLQAVRAELCDMSAARALEPSETVVVDALLGSGIRGRPEGLYLELIELMEGLGRKGSLIISVDVPSGFPSDRQILPAITVTFHDVKEGMSEANSGMIAVADIGIPDRASRYTGPGEMVLYPLPSKNSHKGNNGIVTVIGGGSFSGAPTFSSMAAYRTGADLVYTVVPRRSFNAVAGFSPNLMAFSTSGDDFAVGDVESSMKWCRRSGAVVIGPGMEPEGAVQGFIAEVVRNITCPVVVDAGAIEVVGHDPSLLKGKKAVVTPHSREFEKLTGEKTSDTVEERSKQMLDWAARLGVTILLKGATDIISDGSRLKLNDTGNPGMTVGGTGDVLTGIVAALMSKGCSPFDAARLGAYINGSSGDICFESLSYGLLATDVIDHIPAVLARDIGGVA